jgi:hypothetical protein
MVISRQACRRFLARLLRLAGPRPTRRFVGLVVLALIACSGSASDESASRSRTGSIAQAFTDTDSDGMDDDWETQSFGDLSQTAASDFDADGMTNGEEYDDGFDPTVD